MNQPTEIQRSHHVVAASDAARAMLDQISVAARATHPVAVSGPAGSGKKHAAMAVHSLSPRASGPFDVFSARGVESNAHGEHLFGTHSLGEPGGQIARAAGGSLVIDGFDRLTEEARCQLLDLLKKQAVPARDETSARIFLTSSDPISLPDIPVHKVDIQPLADRPECILPLAAHFLGQFTRETNTEPVGFTADARRWLLEEPWNGNVRELRERIRQAVYLTGGGALSAEALLLAGEDEEVLPFKAAKRAFETRYVEGLLRRCRGNISRAARLAQKDRKDFYDVIRRTGVDPSAFRN